MRFALFYHSLVSDWNHGNAHFLRGIVTELQSRGHDARVYEPSEGWSLKNLLAEKGSGPLREFRQVYPTLESHFFDARTIDLDAELDDADVVLVHEWNDPELVARIGHHRQAHGGYVLLFHDTHHRSATAPEQMTRYELAHYDGALVFGEVIREIYRDRGWCENVWTWHEAADARVFHPAGAQYETAANPGRINTNNGKGPHHRSDNESYPSSLRSDNSPPAPGNGQKRNLPPLRDLIWIGNWGDEERTEEIMQYLVGPVRSLELRARVHGVRYPDEGRTALSEAGIEFGGWLPNYRVPPTFWSSRVTMHIPRRPYRELLHGVPTIRVFEALACGIPLICLNWQDSEKLFRPGRDYLVVDTPDQMTDALQAVLTEPALATELAANGLSTIRGHHTCVHRVDELFAIIDKIRPLKERMASRLGRHSRSIPSPV